MKFGRLALAQAAARAAVIVAATLITDQVKAIGGIAVPRIAMRSNP